MGEISQLTNVCYDHFHGHPSRSLRDVFVDAIWDPNPALAIPMFEQKHYQKSWEKTTTHLKINMLNPKMEVLKSDFLFQLGEF